jgi:PAS domain S-box-containing protein
MTSSQVLNRTVDDLVAEVEDWQLLHTMSTRLIQTFTLDEQLKIVLEVGTRLAGCDRGVISLYSDEQKCLVTRVSQGLNHEALNAISCVAIGDGACGLAFREKERVVIVDTQQDPRYSSFRDYACRYDIQGVCSTPFFGMDGRPLGVLSTYLDEHRVPSERELRLADVCASHAGLLTSRAEVEQALSTERVRSEQVLSAMSDGFIVMDRDFRILQINAEALKMDGRPADKILGLTHWEAWPGSEDLELGLQYKHAMATRTVIRIEQWYKQHGKERCYSIAAHPYSDGLALFYADVTEQRINERIAREGEKRFYQLANSIPQLAWIADKDGAIFWYNERWYQYTGSNYADMQGWKWQSVHHPDMLEKVLTEWTASIKTGEPFEMTFPLRGADGVFRPFYTLVSPLRDDKGDITQWFGTNTDISALADVDKRKDEFLAMLAHELRNPLSPISSAAQLLSLPQISPERIQNASKVITRQVAHMTELIDDLLDVSRVTSGLIKLDRRITNIESILNGAVEQVRSLVDSRNQKLLVQVEQNVPALTGDETRLIQVLANLINNASKYSSHGSKIAISVRSIESKIAIAVQDNGVGISAELLPRVFDLFAQGERTPDRAQGGLGLGLAIVKSIVELHGGTVTAESTGVGQGSTFEILLPAALASSPTRLSTNDAACKAQANLKITIVDDNVDSAESLAAVLAAHGHTVTVKYCGSSLLESVSDAERQDAFILDIGLPGLDGYQLVAELLKLPTASSAHMIALTGYGQSHDKAIGKLAGFHTYFVKPVKFDELALVLEAIEPCQGTTPL